MGHKETSEKRNRKPKETKALRRGWTTGACATAATKAALTAWLTGAFPDPVEIALPKGETPSFPLAREELAADFASASIVKDAGDDPDVTHGAVITATIRPKAKDSGIFFSAGPGVGTVTRPGLPVAVGEPAINPVPRNLMTHIVESLCQERGIATDFEVEISIENGEALALQTWNGRLGIVGGLSVLGTTGVVQPFSCAAWIHSIHRGVDVARAAGLPHILAATGSTSEAAALAIYDLPEHATIDMGDFAGGLLKYLRAHPVNRLTIAGGFAKLTKLAQGAMDLHSGRSQVDFEFLANRDAFEGTEHANEVSNANTAMEVLQIAQRHELHTQLAGEIAALAQSNASAIASKDGQPFATQIEIVVTDRAGTVLAQTGFPA